MDPRQQAAPNDRHRRRRAWPALLACLVVIAAACGTPDLSKPPSTPPSQATAGGGALSIAFALDLAHLDPALAYDYVSWTVLYALYDQLVTYGSGVDLVPGLAKAMPTVSADGLTYTFKLRLGVKFVRGDGSVLRDMTADDVVASLNRILDPGLKPTPSPVGSSFFGIIDGASAVLDGSAKTASGIVAVDPVTVQIKLVKPDRRLLSILAMPFGSILPRELAGEDSAAFEAAPVGTGAYYLADYEHGTRAVLKRNPVYWQADLPKADTVDVRFLIEQTSQLQQARINQLDIMGDVIPSGEYASMTDDPALADRIRHRLDVGVWTLSMDTTDPKGILSDLKVRQAMSMAIDKANVVKLYNGRGAVADCFFPPALPGYDPGCKPYVYDPPAARALMTEAGLADGFETTLYAANTDLSRSATQSIQQDLAQIGITVRVVLQDNDVFIGTTGIPHQAPLVFSAWFQDFPDPSDFYDPILSCASAVAGGSNSAWYCNKGIDALADAALGEPDDPTRFAMYQDIQERVMADSPWVPILFDETVILTSDRVLDNPLHPVIPFDLRRVRVKD